MITEVLQYVLQEAQRLKGGRYLWLRNPITWSGRVQESGWS